MKRPPARNPINSARNGASRIPGNRAAQRLQTTVHWIGTPSVNGNNSAASGARNRKKKAFYQQFLDYAHAELPDLVHTDGVVLMAGRPRDETDQLLIGQLDKPVVLVEANSYLDQKVGHGTMRDRLALMGYSEIIGVDDMEDTEQIKDAIRAAGKSKDNVVGSMVPLEMYRESAIPAFQDLEMPGIPSRRPTWSTSVGDTDVLSSGLPAFLGHELPPKQPRADRRPLAKGRYWHPPYESRGKLEARRHFFPWIPQPGFRELPFDIRNPDKQIRLAAQAEMAALIRQRLEKSNSGLVVKASPCGDGAGNFFIPKPLLNRNGAVSRRQQEITDALIRRVVKYMSHMIGFKGVPPDSFSTENYMGPRYVMDGKTKRRPYFEPLRNYTLHIDANGDETYVHGFSQKLTRRVASAVKGVDTFEEIGHITFGRKFVSNYMKDFACACARESGWDGAAHIDVAEWNEDWVAYGQNESTMQMKGWMPFASLTPFGIDRPPRFGLVEMGDRFSGHSVSQGIKMVNGLGWHDSVWGKQGLTFPQQSPIEAEAVGRLRFADAQEMNAALRAFGIGKSRERFGVLGNLCFEIGKVQEQRSVEELRAMPEDLRADEAFHSYSSIKVWGDGKDVVEAMNRMALALPALGRPFSAYERLADILPEREQRALQAEVAVADQAAGLEPMLAQVLA